MALTRKGLFKMSGICSIILSIVLFIVSIVELLKTGYFGQTQTGSGMVVGVGENKIIGYTCLGFGAAALFGGALLLIGLNFYNKPAFKTILIISSIFILASGALLNLNALALYLGFSSDDEQGFVFKKRETENASDRAIKLQRQIRVLRSMRDEGEISDEEFRLLLDDLIEKNKQ